MKTLSFIIPVFRNEASLEQLLGELEALGDTYPDLEWNYLFVDDGSDDNSVGLLKRLQASNKRIEILQLSRNFGQVAAIIAGLDAVDSDGVVIMSADRQDPVDVIPSLIDAWQTNNDVVIAHRLNRSDGMLERMNARIFQSLMRYSELDFPEGGFDFVLLDRKAVDALNQIEGRNRFLQGDILWLGFEVKLIPYQRKNRPQGKSQWRKLNKLKYLIDGILSTSYWPIRIMSLIGFLFALAAGAYILIIMYLRIFQNEYYTGWAPLMIMILFIGGLIMMMLGLIGEYIWRVYDEVRGRPQYLIKRKISGKEKGEGEA